MLIINHRVNSPAELDFVDIGQGVEIDVHAYGRKLVVTHDSFTDGPELDDWILKFRHEFVILNIKEEGIEDEVQRRFALAGISNYFLLDLSFPSLVRMVRRGDSRVAVRVSEYEPIEQAFRLAGKVDWVWLDLFSGIPISPQESELLRSYKFKICLVSPELHGRDATEISTIRSFIESSRFVVDAVCTKHPHLWV